MITFFGGEIEMRMIINGYLFALFTVMMWSLNLIYSKLLAGILTPSEISFYRWIIGFFVLLPISWHHIKENAAILLTNWHFIILMALTGIGFQNWFIYVAGETADATTMSLISVAGPIFLILLSRQKISIFQTVGVLLAIIGVIDIILRGNIKNLKTFQFVIGDAYMLLSALMFALYAIVQKKIPENISPIAILTLAIGAAAVIFFFPSLPNLKVIHLKQISKLTMVIIVVLGIFNSALAYLSWDIAIKRNGAVQTGMMYYTMPIFAVFFAYMLLGEKIYATQIVGALMVFGGVLLVLFGKAEKT